MIEHLGWDSLEDRRLLFQTTMFHKILMGLVGISFPPEVHEKTRSTRSLNSRPFQQIRVSNDVYKFSFYPRIKVAWNNLRINEDVNINNFKTIALATIKSFV